MKKNERIWNRNFFLLWQGAAFSTFGDVLYSISIGIWVYQKTGSTVWMGFLSSISMFVSMILMPIAGALVDRLNQRNVLVICDAGRGITMILVGIIALFGNLNLEIVLLTALVSALCNVLFTPASLVMFSKVLAPQDLVQGQSISTGTSSLINLVGKGISGALVVLAGVPLVILINGLSLMLSAITEFFIQLPKTQKVQTPLNLKNILLEMKEGIGYVCKNRGFAILMIGILLANLFSSGIGAMYLPFASLKGFSVPEYGLYTSILSLAGLCATLFLGVVKIPEKKKITLLYTTMIAGGIINGVSMVFLNGFIPIASTSFVAQFFNTFGNAILNATLILSVEEELRGRIFGLLIPFSTGGAAFSCIAYGVLAEIIGLYPLILVGSFLSATCIAVMACCQSVRKVIEPQMD